MLDIVISEIPDAEPAATIGDAMHLIIGICIAFIVLFVLIWIVVLFANYLRRHAGKIQSNLGAVPESEKREEEKK